MHVFLTAILLAVLSVMCSADYMIDNHRHSFDQVMKNFIKLQADIDAVVERTNQVGHIGWLNNMCMYFWKIAHDSNVKHICEVGFGNGFSSTLFLTSGNATMISFDLFPKKGQHLKKTDQEQFMNYMPKSQTAGRNFIQHQFPGRFTAYPGFSEKTVPAFIKKNPEYKCDVVYIDGGHQKDPTLTDIRNFKKLAHKDTVLIFDDLELPGVKSALEVALAENTIMPFIECIEGEVLIDKRFQRPGRDQLAFPGKKFCQTKFII